MAEWGCRPSIDANTVFSAPCEHEVSYVWRGDRPHGSRARRARLIDKHSH
jgi:hypothetical protein